MNVHVFRITIDHRQCMDGRHQPRSHFVQFAARGGKLCGKGRVGPG